MKIERKIVIKRINGLTIANGGNVDAVDAVDASVDADDAVDASVDADDAVDAVDASVVVVFDEVEVVAFEDCGVRDL